MILPARSESHPFPLCTTIRHLAYCIVSLPLLTTAILLLQHISVVSTTIMKPQYRLRIMNGAKPHMPLPRRNIEPRESDYFIPNPEDVPHPLQFIGLKNASCRVATIPIPPSLVRFSKAACMTMAKRALRYARSSLVYPPTYSKTPIS